MLLADDSKGSIVKINVPEIGDWNIEKLFKIKNDVEIGTILWKYLDCIKIIKDGIILKSKKMLSIYNNNFDLVSNIL